jgi:stage II sporulation protein D
MIRVLLSTIQSKDSLLFSGGYILHSEEARYAFGQKNSLLYILPLVNGLQLFNQNRNLLYKDYFPIILEPVDLNSRFIYKGNTYSGSVSFQPASESAVHLINTLPLETYLSGVVPEEIPSTKKENFEAIKAQAICARTYALNRIKDNSTADYDLEASITDQVYRGYSRQSTLAKQAIEETRGVVITYLGQPATVYYHSTCGGRLESAANVWPGRNLPYLTEGFDSVDDIYSCSLSPYFRWLETRSFVELDSLFDVIYHKSQLTKAVEDTTEIDLNLQITKRNSSGRVTDLQIIYGDTTVLLSGYEIRHFFKDKNGKSLPSNLFYITQQDDSTLTIHGGGFGHGVGMCQYGALYMAQHGFMHYHIISKYFPGTKLVRKY